jgi:hypothetical protein
MSYILVYLDGDVTSPLSGCVLFENTFLSLCFRKSLRAIPTFTTELETVNMKLCQEQKHEFMTFFSVVLVLFGSSAGKELIELRVNASHMGFR